MIAMLFMSTLCENGPAELSFHCFHILEVLEQQPGASVALAAQAAVDEILIDRHEDESARRQQLAQVAVARVGVVERVVVAVDDEHEREGPVAVRIPHAAVDRRPC